MKITDNYCHYYRNNITSKRNEKKFTTVSKSNINTTQTLAKYPLIIPFLGQIKNQNADNQLSNMQKTFDKKCVKYCENITSGQKKLIEDFLSGKNNNITHTKIIGSNGSTYILKRGIDKIVLKAQHLTQDGIEKGVAKKTNSPDFDNEVAKLEKLPENINTTRLLANMQLSENEAKRKVIAISFIKGTKLSDTKNSLNQNNLQKLYADLFELDKKQIFHRDLNAFNIMYNEKNEELYILDYGAGKFFDEMDKNANDAKKLYALKKANEPKNNKICKNNFIVKKEMQELINKLKYRKYDGLALSNVENFEVLGLLPYLKISSDKVGTQETDKINSADKLFLTHLKLKGKYHQERIKFLESDKYKSPNKEEHIKNEKIMAKVLSLIDTDNITEVTKDIAQVELLRIKMANSQKVARLFVANNEHNYKMAMYWNMDLGVTSRYAIPKIKELYNKYNGDEIMRDYFNLNLNIARFYNQEIFPEVFDSIFGIAKNAITDSSESEVKGITQTMEDGCWLDSSKRAPSNYVPKSPHKFNLLQF